MHDKVLSLAKSKLISLKVLICILNIGHNDFVLIDNVPKSLMI